MPVPGFTPVPSFKETTRLKILPQLIQPIRFDYCSQERNDAWISVFFGQQQSIPLLIFFARIAEASLESVRTIYISKGHANLAAYVGIVKTGIWLISTGLVLTDLMQFWNLFAYLAGYGIGTVLGMAIENLISIGFVIVRLITPGEPQTLMSRLSTLGYGMTRIEVPGVSPAPSVSSL